MLLDSKKCWVITSHFDPYDDEELNENMKSGINL